jgi:hypothetical protein
LPQIIALAGFSDAFYHQSNAWLRGACAGSESNVRSTQSICNCIGPRTVPVRSTLQRLTAVCGSPLPHPTTRCGPGRSAVQHCRGLRSSSAFALQMSRIEHPRNPWHYIGESRILSNILRGQGRRGLRPSQGGQTALDTSQLVLLDVSYTCPSKAANHNPIRICFMAATRRDRNGTGPQPCCP